jgi:hypothetical protein
LEVNGVLSLSQIIDYLLSLMRDEQARAEFDQDPNASLAAAGLEGATAQDVRDAQLVMSDRGYVRSEGGSSSSGGDDPVQEISYTTRNYQVTEDAPDVFNIDNRVVNIDDRDITIEDSFNSDDDVTIIDDSFNKSVENDVTAIQDNDTIVVQDNDTLNEAPGTAPAAGQGTAPEPEPEPVETLEAEPEPPAEDFAPEEPADIEEPVEADAAAI